MKLRTNFRHVSGYGLSHPAKISTFRLEIATEAHFQEAVRGIFPK